MARLIDFEKVASNLLANHGLDQRLPIDVEALSVLLGIKVMYHPFGEELSGVLVKEREQTIIGVNSAHPVTRQRFTIAHELGHFILKHKGELFVDKTLSKESVVVRRDGKSSLGTFAWEVHANQFAAALLMPKALVLAQIAKRLDKRVRVSVDDLLGDLAKLFLVSKQAMEFRLTNLGTLIPG